MGAAETVAALTGFEHRGAGTNAERRAALWLSQELSNSRRNASIETFWCRPNWALTHAWHAGLALAGSLVSVSSPKVGGAMILVALVSLTLDAVTGVSLGRRLTPERASQNVISQAADEGPPIKLIVTANYDSGRTGLAYRQTPRRLTARLRALTGRATLGWLGWLAVAIIWVLVTAILRDTGATGSGIGVAQLIPTAGLLLAFVVLLELASSQFGPGANDNASGVAVALALIRALDVSPPRRVSVEVVLQGASDGAMSGLAHHIRRRRRELKAAATIVLGIGPCGDGDPHWWQSDGSFLPLRYLRRLTQIAEGATGPQTDLGATPHFGRGVSPAFPARFAGLPAITIGCLDGSGLAPRSHQTADVLDPIQRSSMDRLVELALTLVDAIDADLARSVSGTAASSRTAA
jgi:hypothetical protein